MLLGASTNEPTALYCFNMTEQCLPCIYIDTKIIAITAFYPANILAFYGGDQSKESNCVFVVFVAT